MGGGYWSSSVATSYSVANYGTSNLRDLGTMHVQDVYRATHLDHMLNPLNVVRECCDSEDHPQSLPVILALDVTGSMGHAATMCAAKLDEIMTELYKTNTNVEFCVMGIGDLACDDAPLQVTQFESDIRILDQTTKTFFEGGGGGNGWESYTQAWYFGLNRCKLDCWKRGERGIIITLGDEPLNPYLPARRLSQVIGGEIPEDIETMALYEQASEKFEIYHIAITDESSYDWYKDIIEDTWRPLLGDNLLIAESKQLPQLISAIVNNHSFGVAANPVTVNEDGISW
jgi:hypothetical protein